MTKKKLQPAYIANDSTRKATFKKRKKGLIKKVHELSTLCGIKACAVVYSQYESDPEVWPSNSGAENVIQEFKALPEMDQQKKMMDQESFLRQRVAKASEQLKKERKKNRELEMTEVMFQCLVGNMGMFHMNIMDLNDLGYLIDQYLKDLNRRKEILDNPGLEIGESSNIGDALAVVPATTPPAGTITEEQLRLQIVPHEESRDLNLNLNHQQNHPQRLDSPSPAPAQQIGFQFMDDNHHQNQHHYNHQEPQIPNHSSSTPAAGSSSSALPLTGPNLTNNIWFH